MQFNPPAIGSLWLHKNNNIYKVLLNANVDSEREDYPPTVVYEDVETGTVYAKPLDTFHRSRIEYVIKDLNSPAHYDNKEIRRVMGKDLIDAEGHSKEEYDDGRY